MRRTVIQATRPLHIASKGAYTLRPLAVSHSFCNYKQSYRWKRNSKTTHAKSSIISGGVLSGLFLLQMSSMCCAYESNCDCEELNMVEKLELVAEDPVCGMTEFAAKYEMLSQIGRGGNSTVFLARNRHTNEYVAVKKMDHDVVFPEEIEREIFIMELLAGEEGMDASDNHVVQLKDVFRSTCSTYLVMEFVPGYDLYDVLTTSGVKSNFASSKRERIVVMLRQLVKAISHVHAKGLMHMDLKPDNILISTKNPEACELKLADFGSASFQLPYQGVCSRSEYIPVRQMRRKTKRARGSINLSNCSSGTAAYWPPEMIESREASPATDMWALGCIMYVLITGKHPFDRDGKGNIKSIEHNILHKDAQFVEDEWKGFEDIKCIVHSLLSKDKNSRMSGETLLSNSVIKE